LLPLKEELAAQLGRSPERIRKALMGASPRLLDLIPFVGAFLGRFSEEAMEGQRLGGGSMRGVYEELSRLLLGLADKNGLCVVVEDRRDGLASRPGPGDLCGSSAGNTAGPAPGPPRGEPMPPIDERT
jgi:hypothetical protein